MGMTCSTHWEDEKLIQKFSWKTWREALRRPMIRWEDNIKMDIKRNRMYAEWIELAQNRVPDGLWTRWCTRNVLTNRVIIFSGSKLLMDNQSVKALTFLHVGKLISNVGLSPYFKHTEMYTICRHVYTASSYKCITPHMLTLRSSELELSSTRIVILCSLSLFNGTASTKKPRMRWYDNHEWWLGEDLKGNECSLFQVTLLIIRLERLRKAR
jgi:hypothetical protein